MSPLPVSELFETIQGEATHTGTPSVFIRMQGCPVGCPWCDTKYTWMLNQKQLVPFDALASQPEHSDTWALVEVDALVEEVLHHSARHVVITGGEPCLYDLRDLTAKLIDAGRSVQIETSGTHVILADPRVWVTVSPKPNMPGGFAVLDQALARADEIKMPVGKIDDVLALEGLLARGVHHPYAPVYLQPLSLSAKATDLCINVATARGFRVSVQVHALAGWR